MSIDFRFFLRLSLSSSPYCHCENFNYMTVCSYKIYYTTCNDKKHWLISWVFYDAVLSTQILQ